MSTHPTAVRDAEVVTQDKVDQFRTDGYCVLSGVIPARLLDLLDEEGERAIANVHAQMDSAGTDVLGGSRRGRQYIPGNCRATQPRLDEFLLGDVLQRVRDRLIAPGSNLLWEQYSVKLGTPPGESDEAGYSSQDGNPQSLGKFSWHQDSGYVPHDHPPYLTCWVPLDDTTEENGALYVLPFSELGIRTRVTHEADPDNGDLVGYFGPNPGVLVPVQRGDMVCFSSTLFHRSGRNRTAGPRRAYLAQYAPAQPEGGTQDT